MIMFIRKSENFQVRNGRVICNGLEIILCFWIIYNLYMGYNGIALLVFADIIFNTKNGHQYNGYYQVYFNYFFVI